MGRASVKENKNIYQQCREKMGLTREKASEVVEGLSPDRIEKIENERSYPHPDEVLIMAEGYKDHYLCNHYCAHECPIGQQYVPEIKPKALSDIVIGMVTSIEAIDEKHMRLMAIAKDGKIDENEVKEFVELQKELEAISREVESLQLWSEQMIADGCIDKELYDKYTK